MNCQQRTDIDKKDNEDFLKISFNNRKLSHFINLKTTVMDRKTFIRTTSAGIFLAVPAITILSCSSSDDSTTEPDPNPDPDPDPDPDPTAGNCLENGTTNSISSNHGHSLTIPKDDVEAGTAKTYTLSEGNAHTHQVTLSEDDFASLKNNNSISATSTSDSGHTHGVTVSCA